MYTKDEIFEKVCKMLKEVTNNPNLILTLESKFENIEGWDSLNTVSLELEVETHFDIDFEMGEFINYKTIDSLIERIAQLSLK
jgi:acyl carrier protein